MADTTPTLRAALAAEQAEPVAEVRDPHFGGSSYEASMLRELLARIHGDGGHYVAEHGLDKALESADRLVAEWRAAPPAPARQEPVSRTVDLWFFRELSDEQRMSLFRMAGLPVNEIRSDATQRQCLRNILGAAPARQPAPALTVGMLMEAGLMVGSTPDSVGTSNWAVRMLGALRALAVDQPDAPPAPAPTWPEWAEQILKIVREYSGYDGYDDEDGVDLPEEVREALEELTTQIERLEAKAPAPARQEPLTSEQVKSIVRDAGYDHAPAQHRADFINGMRHAERAHGITAAPAEGGA